jgi:hypothetical protein
MWVLVNDVTVKMLAIIGTTLTYALIHTWRSRRRGKGYIRLWQTRRFPSWGWLKDNLNFFRSWGIDGFAHVSFGFMASISTAIFSFYFLNMTLQQYGGLSAFNIAQDILFWGKVETTWTNICHRKLGASHRYF